MAARFRSVVDVFVLLRGADGRVLLMARANTGFAYGALGIPSGHLEEDESVVQRAMFVDMARANMTELAERVGIAP